MTDNAGLLSHLVLPKTFFYLKETKIFDAFSQIWTVSFSYDVNLNQNLQEKLNYKFQICTTKYIFNMNEFKLFKKYFRNSSLR